jgi:hypothetical protein
MPAEKIVPCRFRAMNPGDIEATYRCHTIILDMLSLARSNRKMKMRMFSMFLFIVKMRQCRHICESLCLISTFIIGPRPGEGRCAWGFGFGC